MQDSEFMLDLLTEQRQYASKVDCLTDANLRLGDALISFISSIENLSKSDSTTICKFIHMMTSLSSDANNCALEIEDYFSKVIESYKYINK